MASFPPFNFYPAAWFAFVPLFFAIQGMGKRKTAFLFFFSSFLLFLYLFHWLSIFGWYAWVGSALCEGIFSSIWGLAVFPYLSKPHFSFRKYLVPALAYALLEVWRTLGPLGMPWGNLGYTQWRFLPMLQWSSLLGEVGLGFLIMECNLLLFFAIQEKSCRLLLFFGVCFALPLAFGLIRLDLPMPSVGHVKIGLVQTNDPQTLKWSQANFQAMLMEMTSLVNEASNKNLNVILFPETALAGYLDNNPGLQALVHFWALKTKAYLAVGTLKSSGGSPQNAVVLINPQGIQQQSYEKIKLVPFGEYLPAPFRPLRGHWHVLDPIVDFKPGDSFVVFHLPHASFSVMICFESSFGWMARKFVLKGAEFLAIATNDAWFEGTNAQEEHAAMAVFRAVETGRTVVQAGNTGISCIVDPKGRILAWQKPKTRALVVGEIPLETQSTLYDKIGGFLPYLWLFLFLFFSAKDFFFWQKSEKR
jgi:apolipoprotein N-acyltransferase